MAARVLDDTDRALIRRLIAEPRATHRRLAAQLGLNEITVATRLRRLADPGVVSTTIAVDWRAAGYVQSLYLWVCCEQRPVIEVAREVGQIEGVQTVCVVLGPADVFVHALLTGGADAVLSLQSAVARVQGARVTETNLVLRNYVHRLNAMGLPVVESTMPPLPNPVVSLDELDARLCDELAADARRSNRQLARILNTSERTIRARIRRLQDAGLIRIVTMVDTAAGLDLPGPPSRAFVGIRTVGDIGAAASALGALSSVSTLAATTGDAELYAVVTAADAAELADVVLEQIRAIPSVRSTTTRVLGQPVSFGTRLRRLL